MARFNTLSVNNLTVDAISGAGALATTNGKKIYVDAANGSDGNDGLSPNRALKLLETAHDMCTAGNNDTVYLIGSTSWATQTATLSWDKSYTHLIGINSASHKNMRSRIYTTTAAVSPVVEFTADGCYVENIFVSNEGAANTNLGAVLVTGQKMHFKNCHFLGAVNDLAGAVATAYSLKLTGCEDSLFEDCYIGDDTINRTAACAELLIGGASKRILFKNCTISTYGTGGTNFWVNIPDSGGIDRYVWFKDCTFINGTLVTSQILDYGMNINATPGGMVLVDNLLWYGATDLQNNNAKCILGRTPVFDTQDGGLAAAQTKS